MEEAETDATENSCASEAERASAVPPPPPISPPALTPAPAAGEEGPAFLPEAGGPGCSGSRPPELEPERSLGRLRGRFEDFEEELEEDEEMEEEEEEEEEMSHFSLRLESGRPESEDEEEVPTTLPTWLLPSGLWDRAGRRPAAARCPGARSTCVALHPRPPRRGLSRLDLFCEVPAGHLGHSGSWFFYREVSACREGG